MLLETYFRNNFQDDLQKLNLEYPNDVILEKPLDFFVDPDTSFFGGKNWSNYEHDTNEIEHIEEFLISLFTLSTVNYFIKNNSQLNVTQPEILRTPSLGWCGYGPHYEHPLKIFTNNFSLFFNLINRKDEIVALFKDIVKKLSSKDKDLLKEKIKNNSIDSKDKYEAFLELLAPEEEEYWKSKMRSIFS